MKTDLSLYDNRTFDHGRSVRTRKIWYLLNAIFFRSCFPFVSFKIYLLRKFGANIGKGVMIKPYVNIKYPWNIIIRDHSWIGEQVWLDSVGPIEIGSNCCISQGAKLITGNHNFRNERFQLMVSKIVIEDGVWIGCFSLLCGNVVCEKEAVLAAGSVASGWLKSNTVYKGVPATEKTVRYKEIQAEDSAFFVNRSA